jgi:hypothetical protein
VYNRLNHATAWWREAKECMEIKRKNVLEKHLDLKMRRVNDIEMGLRKCVMVGSFFNLLTPEFYIQFK